jgi:hypothetical protein
VKSILERHFVNYETPGVYPEHVISGILHLQRCEVLLQNMITSQRTSLVKSMIEVMQIPLDSYEDLVFVHERLTIYYSMLERSLQLSYGQHDIKRCQQFTAQQLSIIGNKPKTPLLQAWYMTLMEVKHKADCEQPLATIDVMNRIAKLFGYGPLRGTTEVPEHCNLFLREVECARPTTSLSCKGRKEEAVRVARAECVYSPEELSYYKGNQDWHIYRDYNRVMQPIVYAGRVLISDEAVTPPLEGTSTPVKARITWSFRFGDAGSAHFPLRIVVLVNALVHDGTGGIDSVVVVDDS